MTIECIIVAVANHLNPFTPLHSCIYNLKYMKIEEMVTTTIYIEVSTVAPLHCGRVL